ncbi:MAG TPA: FecR domain-containing protein [Gemmataceae bacterium]|nr:FecR domain-containing protein [Gemmataceae bacterium]
MNVPEFLKDAIDDYLHGLLDEARLQELEEALRADADLRRYFVRYARLHTDLHLEVRARQAGDRALGAACGLAGEPVKPQAGRRRMAFAVAASLLLGIGVAWWLLAGARQDRSEPERAVAWLVNAQNCRWVGGVEPTGDMQAGKSLNLEAGLAEIRFACGARVVLDGPAVLELLSGRSARLQRGKLTARVPGPATGFEIVSPQAKVIDLGTEFGVAVAEGGGTDVYVFEGTVEAHATGSKAGAVSLTRDQAAHIAAGKVQPVEPGVQAQGFVRAIMPAPVIVPRTLRLTFEQAVADSLLDGGGGGTGLTHRLSGTGTRLPERDPNLRLDTVKKQLELTTTNSDLNRKYRLYHGEYLGVRLADLGFTGKEDFAVSVKLLDIPALEFVGQFGLYAGSRNDKNIRGGLLSSKRQEPGQYTQFLVNNHRGLDADIHRVGLLTTGSDLQLTLKRTAGKYTLTVENLTTDTTSTLTIRHPVFLDRERDLYVGVFGANTQSEVRRTLIIKDFQATVWTVSRPAVP